MAFVVTLAGFKPVPRFDSVPWTLARLQESANGTSGWAQIETFALTPVDADPSVPMARNFTSDQATLAAGYYRIVWEDAATNQDVTGAVFSEEFDSTGYPSRATLVAESNVDELTTLPADQQDELWHAAISAIEAFCGQSFTAEDTALDLDGSGGGVLFLPRRLAVLTGLSVEASALDHTDVGLSVKRDRLHVLSSGGVLNYYTQALRELDDNLPRTFTAGPGSVTVTGTWGWLPEEFPPLVRLAIRTDMEDQALAQAHQLSGSLRAYHALGIRWMSQGELAIGTATNETVGGARGTSQVAVPSLSDRVKNLLEPYRWASPAGVAI